MGLRIYGIGAAENTDNAGEQLRISGLDDNKLNLIRDEHSEDNFFHKVGAVTGHKKIFSEKDCENPKQLRCWKSVGGIPFLYIEAELADDTEHPNAKSTAELIKFTNRPDIAKTLTVGFSIDGGIIERLNQNGQHDDDGKILSKTLATSVAVTIKPCNPKCKIFLENDLTKSDLSARPPKAYFLALKKSQATKSLNEADPLDFKLLLGLNKLKKSLEDYSKAFTSHKCVKCGTGVKFFKSSETLPNGCSKCGSNFSMSDIWKSLNK